MRRLVLAAVFLATLRLFASALDPRGREHIVIGTPGTSAALKTFVEPEGNFSPGAGTFGVSFWLFDGQLTAPTMDGVEVEHGLAPGGYLIPWSRWQVRDVEVRSEICQTGEPAIVAARVTLTNRGVQRTNVSLFVALRPLGPAGGAVKRVDINSFRDTVSVDGQPALVAFNRIPSAAGASARDDAGELAANGLVPPSLHAESASGDASATLRFDVTLSPGATRTFRFLSPLRGVPFRRPRSVDALFAQSADEWRQRFGGASIATPDDRWNELFVAAASHIAMAAPDAAPLNYNVFTRDGAFMAAALDEAGMHDLAAAAIDRFLAQPFSGRPNPEADNPGEALWVAARHAALSGDRDWLARSTPAARELAALITYLRETPEPHWVSTDDRRFGDDVPHAKRHLLVPGSCDGNHPEFTEAFDIAGLRGAAALDGENSRSDRTLANRLLDRYSTRFSPDLAAGYGSYAVLWPCRLYPLDSGNAHDRFAATPAQPSGEWRYFALSAAHQALLAGNRESAHDTLDLHFAIDSMRGWYALDEGGDSDAGTWPSLRTTWRATRAMPHGWAMAELFLLLRDCLLYEDGNAIVLFAGVPREWLRGTIELRDLPTEFGRVSVSLRDGVLTTSGAHPPGGFIVPGL